MHKNKNPQSLEKLGCLTSQLFPVFCPRVSSAPFLSLHSCMFICWNTLYTSLLSSTTFSGSQYPSPYGNLSLLFTGWSSKCCIPFLPPTLCSCHSLHLGFHLCSSELGFNLTLHQSWFRLSLSLIPLPWSPLLGCSFPVCFNPSLSIQCLQFSYRYPLFRSSPSPRTNHRTSKWFNHNAKHKVFIMFASIAGRIKRTKGSSEAPMGRSACSFGPPTLLHHDKPGDLNSEGFVRGIICSLTLPESLFF